MSKFEQFLKDLEGASVLELNDLVKAIEEKFGVSAAAVGATTPQPVDSRFADAAGGWFSFTGIPAVQPPYTHVVVE